MRILWLCNIVLPELAEIFSFRKQNEGGWLTGAWRELNNINKYNLAICVPVRNPSRMIDGENEGYKFYSFLTISQESNTKIEDQCDRFKTIIGDYKPDIIHIWGTEYEHSYAMAKACEELGISERVVINIQGLITYCAKVYRIGITHEIYNAIDDQGKSIADGEKAFRAREKFEKEVFRLSKFCIVRTEWDKACVLSINPQITYFNCGEILRDGFYKSKKWNLERSEKHSIFISQAAYPIKGLHIALEELSLLKNKYDDLKIYVGGEDLSLSNEPYAKYINDKIIEYGLKDTVFFLGQITEQEMINYYLRSNVFLSTSLIENSSNSICEAMLLGTPVVASFVGGTPSLIQHEYDGLSYPLEEPNMMRYYIEELFDSEELCNRLSKNEIIKATERINNKNNIIKKLSNIYLEISNNI